MMLAAPRSLRWLGDDGRHLVFPTAGSGECSDPVDLYLRDIVAETTVEISGQPVSGPDCDVAFIKATPANDPEPSVFFYTRSRLEESDKEPVDCFFMDEQGADIYRYGIESGELECTTCAVPNADVHGVPGGGFNIGAAAVGISDDGSRIYFSSRRRLVRGEGVTDKRNVYRLDVASGDLKWVGPVALGESDDGVGDQGYMGRQLTQDGSVMVFRSNIPELNELTHSDNGGFYQYYRYDDRQGSLVCMSCPSTAARTDLPRGLTSNTFEVTPNNRALAENGTFVFVTPESLVDADQNGARPNQPLDVGADIYEWRDGRVMLVSDGARERTSVLGITKPEIAGITPSGRDVFFLLPAQLTRDAIDAYTRLYTARIGGGIAFPPPPTPCPLETCQGEAKGAPAFATPGTSNFRGPGDRSAAAKRKRCPTGSKRRGRRCTKKAKQRKRGREKARHRSPRRAGHDAGRGQ
jgi:hypothetical protein